MKTIDLFAGMGGAHLAGAYLDWDIIASVERNEACQEVLRRHFPDMPVYDDVLTFHGTGTGADLVTMGFPCKNISQAGDQTGLQETEEGEEPNQSSLFFAGVRIAAEARAPFLFIENVFNFLSNGKTRKGEDLYIALTHLQKKGYGDVRWTTNRASDVGAPHQRARVWLLARYTGSVGFEGEWARRLAGRSMEWPVKGEVSGNRFDVHQEKLPILEGGILWPTMRASDYKGVGPVGSTSHEKMAAQNYLTATIQDVTGISGNLNPEWCEPFMGWPVGWTIGDEGRWFADEDMWPMPRGVEQHDWEAPRLIPKTGNTGKRVPVSRADRIEALGNCWVPQQAVAAWNELHRPPPAGRVQLNLLK